MQRWLQQITNLYPSSRRRVQKVQSRREGPESPKSRKREGPESLKSRKWKVRVLVLFEIPKESTDHGNSPKKNTQTTFTEILKEMGVFKCIAHTPKNSQKSKNPAPKPKQKDYIEH